MILIADSGSTKTDWRFIDADSKISQFDTKGINPYQQNKTEIISIIQSESWPNERVSEIHFYGAGCSSEQNKDIIAEALKVRFKEAKIFIADDMLAAARSLSGKESGIICILGTGSNACLYDGNKIIEQIPSLGYVMGDEGSGNWLGRQLINDYFGHKLSTKNKRLFEEFGEFTVPDILDRVYRNQRPSNFLASYSRLILENIADRYFYQLVKNSFEHFIAVNLCYFKEYKVLPIHFAGSIAYLYSNILRQVAFEKNIQIGKIVQSPIAGLTLFHENS